MNQLSVENTFLSISGKKILDGSAINIHQGKRTGLLGSNGAGKSVFLQTIFGIRKAASCDVFFNSQKIKKACYRDGLVNYLPQYRFLPAAFSLNDFIQQFHVDKTVLLRYFPELSGLLHQSIDELSGGEERLFSALLIILAPAKFTMLDEPFTHLMPLYIERLKTLLQYQKQIKGFIVTDHLYQSILEITDDLYFMKSGQSFLLKNPEEDLALHQYIAATHR